METLKRNSDPLQAALMSAYMRNQFVYFGVRAPKRRLLCKIFLDKAKYETQVDWNFIRACWRNKYRELQYVALDYLFAIKNLLTSKDIACLKQIALDKSWWDTIDGLDRIIGSVALNFPDVNQILLAWSLDENFWLRRIAIDHQLFRKDKTNTALLEEIILNNLGQKEFFINKAIGWSLREYSKTNHVWVKNFIDKHHDHMSKLTIHEASKYL